MMTIKHWLVVLMLDGSEVPDPVGSQPECQARAAQQTIYKPEQFDPAIHDRKNFPVGIRCIMGWDEPERWREKKLKEAE